MSLLTVVLTVVAYLRVDMSKVNVYEHAPSGAVGQVETATELVHFHQATFILGSAGILELFQVVASMMHGQHRLEKDDGDELSPGAHLPRWTDNQLMLAVYGVLFAFYYAMAMGSFGVVHPDPFASNRPVYGLRYVEWSIAVPILMTLVGRSIPRRPHTPAVDTVPAILLTIVYIYASWLALVIDDYVWRIVLIVISFVGYALAAWDQFNWFSNYDEAAPSGRLTCGMVLVQVALFGVYGVVYLLAAFDIVQPVTEQALYTFGDSTAKVGHSAFLLAMQQQNLVAAVCASRQKATVAVSDLVELINSASAPIFTVDLEGRVVIWNRKLVELTGRSAEKVKGVKVLDVISPSCHSEVAAALKACNGDDADATKCFHADLTVVQDDNGSGGSSCGDAVVSLILSATRQRDADPEHKGNIAGIVLVGQDRTQVAHYEALEERKNRFMATVSHELRSPLHGICGLSAALEKDEGNEGRRKQLGMVHSCATRLLDLVANIMDMSAQRSKSKEKPLSKDPVHLSAIIDEVVALVSNATDKAMRPLLSRECALVSTIADVPLPLVEGDAYKLTQVFFNLLTNSCKFCRSGRIEVSAQCDNAEGLVSISISDTGIGIAPEALKRIFEPFEQEDSSTARNFEGIGIGLAVSKGVVEQHGGSIVVRSTQGRGSVFTVRLPAQHSPQVSEGAASTPVCPAPVQRRQGRHPSLRFNGTDSVPLRALQRRPSLTNSGSVVRGRSPSPKPSHHKTPAGRPTVLSVDDDAVNQEVIKAALADYEVHVAMDGSEALRYFDEHSRLPDVVLLDVMMPGMSGYEVCTTIRNQLQLSPSVLPIIMLSANEPVPESIIEGLGSGCNDYVAKPFDTAVLIARVQTALQVKRLHEIEVEHAQHTKLLHEIMPPHIVQRLVTGEKCIAESQQCVTILFSDIVGWTNIAESIPTCAVIALLNELFSAFDALLDKHGVYKVETIGDAYMVAAGHDGGADHAKRVMLMGLAMLEAVKAVRPPPQMRLQIRVGVHSGPAFTGVVGQKVPRYCFFGDTVNVSSRMESNGVPGCIHISQAARDCVGNTDLGGASFVSRGPIEVKGKGRMDTYFVVPKGSPLPPLEPARAKASEVTKGNDSPHSPTQSTTRPTDGDHHVEQLRSQLAAATDSVAALRAERDELRQRGSQLAAANVSIAELRAERDELHQRGSQLAAANDAIAKLRAERDELRQRESQQQLVADSPAVAEVRSPLKAADRSQLLELRQFDDEQATGLTSTASSAKEVGTGVTALRLELAVKKKALQQARCALFDKDDQLDAKELELQHALVALRETGLSSSSRLLLTN
jgi:signal transduction histidine kinase/DNA-binding NarL/FixJ family response regulator/bacteriorhodopsin